MVTRRSSRLVVKWAQPAQQFDGWAFRGRAMMLQFLRLLSPVSGPVLLVVWLHFAGTYSMVRDAAGIGLVSGAMIASASTGGAGSRRHERFHRVDRALCFPPGGSAPALRGRSCAGWFLEVLISCLNPRPCRAGA